MKALQVLNNLWEQSYIYIYIYAYAYEWSSKCLIALPIVVYWLDAYTVHQNWKLPCRTQHLLYLLDERHPKTSTLCDLDKHLEEEGKLFAHCSFLLHNTPCQSLQILHIPFLKSRVRHGIEDKYRYWAMLWHIWHIMLSTVASFSTNRTELSKTGKLGWGKFPPMNRMGCDGVKSTPGWQLYLRIFQITCQAVWRWMQLLFMQAK
jgi:hypothetical protein